MPLADVDFLARDVEYLGGSGGDQRHEHGGDQPARGQAREQGGGALHDLVEQAVHRRGVVRGEGVDDAVEQPRHEPVRGRHPAIREGIVTVRDGEIWLMNAHISPYSHGNKQNHEPLRTRKLLLHRREIEKLERETVVKGMTLVVTRIYWKNGRIKFEIGVAKGKKLYDKRETEMRRTVERETRAQLKERGLRH